jgi:hypothetical protein
VLSIEGARETKKASEREREKEREKRSYANDKGGGKYKAS